MIIKLYRSVIIYECVLNIKIYSKQVFVVYFIISQHLKINYWTCISIFTFKLKKKGKLYFLVVFV